MAARKIPSRVKSEYLVPSPQVATYDLQPEMNSTLLTDKLVAAIESGDHDFIVCNYPNGDMVGHTGDFDAAVKACEAVDKCIGRIMIALEKTGSECLITADHGNAEQMKDNVSGQAHTAHTCEPVPLIYVGRNAEIAQEGALSDIAPTILSLMNMPQPDEMTGSSLLNAKLNSSCFLSVNSQPANDLQVLASSFTGYRLPYWLNDLLLCSGDVFCSS